MSRKGSLEAVSATLETSVSAGSDPRGRKQVGIVSAIFLIFNRMIGTGIFATPSTIFSQCGSVGLTLIVWVCGSLIAAAGLMVYLEWGSAIPKNGGEKNYLEYVYKRPRFLATCMYGAYVVLLGWAASNSVVFGEYILTAAGTDVNRWNQRGLGVACVSFAFLMHSVALKWGLRLQNLLGVFKLVIIVMMVVIGWVALSGRLHIEPTHNFRHGFSGTNASAYGIVNALYNVIWSYIGYSNANYALSETKNPNRTLKIAAPIALVSVSIMYLFVNIAYFAVVPREQILSSGRILAASFFDIVFGSTGEKALSVFVALSALGNVMSVIFSQGRIVQELAMENVLPLSRLLASNKPFNSPLTGLLEHWLVCIIVILAPPPGDAYNFILNLISYPLSVVNCFVALGLLWINFNPGKFPDFHAPIKATWPVTLFFLLSSIYLVVAPFVPPESPSQNIYNDLPYYLHCVVAYGIFGAGAIYWLVFYVALPRIYGYTHELVEYYDENNWVRSRIQRVDGAGTITNQEL